jgi:hypothetical protein
MRKPICIRRFDLDDALLRPGRVSRRTALYDQRAHALCPRFRVIPSGPLRVFAVCLGKDCGKEYNGRACMREIRGGWASGAT